MGISYSIDVDIDADFDQHNIGKILHQGVTAGLVYYDNHSDDYPRILTPMSITECVNRVYLWHTGKIDVQGIYAHIDDTYAFL